MSTLCALLWRAVLALVRAWPEVQRRPCVHARGHGSCVSGVACALGLSTAAAVCGAMGVCGRALASCCVGWVRLGLAVLLAGWVGGFGGFAPQTSQ